MARISSALVSKTVIARKHIRKECANFSRRTANRRGIIPIAIKRRVKIDKVNTFAVHICRNTMRLSVSLSGVPVNIGDCGLPKKATRPCRFRVQMLLLPVALPVIFSVSRSSPIPRVFARMIGGALAIAIRVAPPLFVLSLRFVICRVLIICAGVNLSKQFARIWLMPGHMLAASPPGRVGGRRIVGGFVFGIHRRRAKPPAPANLRLSASADIFGIVLARRGAIPDTA